MQPSAFGAQLSTIVGTSSLTTVQHAMGAAGKESATKAAVRDLGGDRAMSGLRRKVALSSGYDLEGDNVIVHLRPKGLWMLANTGRHKQGVIRPRKGKKAVRTPMGLRRTSHYTPSRGLHTVDDAIEDMTKTVPVAAAKAVAANIRNAGF